MSEKNKGGRPPDPNTYSPAEARVYHEDLKKWQAAQVAQGLPTTPRPEARKYSQAEIINGVLRKDQAAWDKAANDLKKK